MSEPLDDAAKRARAERAAPGLPEHITDDAVLDWIAALLTDAERGGG